jgi:hypothetical protein
MGRLIVSAQMTMDCVMDRLEGRFDAEGEAGEHGLEQPSAADAIVLGRETYEQLARYQPAADGPYAGLIDPIPKFVASRTLEEPPTRNTLGERSPAPCITIDSSSSCHPSREGSSAWPHWS